MIISKILHQKFRNNEVLLSQSYKKIFNHVLKKRFFDVIYENTIFFKNFLIDIKKVVKFCMIFTLLRMRILRISPLLIF